MQDAVRIFGADPSSVIWYVRHKVYILGAIAKVQVCSQNPVVVSSVFPALAYERLRNGAHIAAGRS